MKVVGIIAEYNPFHNGHKYQIEQIKERTQADYVIVAMSGNFLQRGVPALCDKYARAQMALSCGADLVLEIPVVWSTASAEYFAKAGVTLLKNTGVVTHLGFGAETDDLTGLQKIASILKNEPTYYKDELTAALAEGNSFPVARKKAIMNTLFVIGREMSTEDLSAFLDSPNNILAIEYLKALPDFIEPVLIKRQGAGYHDTEIDTPLASATAIRRALFRKDVKNPIEAGNLERLLSSAMPKEAYEVLESVVKENALLDTEDLSEILGYRLLMEKNIGFSHYADCSNDFSNKITNQLKNYTGIEDFVQLLKSKDITYTRICRNLLHILLDIKTMDYADAKEAGIVPYLRMLGFKKSSSELLGAIKEKGHVPLISKVADAASILAPESYAILEKDLDAASLYYQLLTTKRKVPVASDFTKPIVIVP